MQKFYFKLNHLYFSVRAVDGHEAFKVAYSIVGAEAQRSEKLEIGLYCSTCGEMSGGYKFCSQNCFANYKKESA